MSAVPASAEIVNFAPPYPQVHASQPRSSSQNMKNGDFKSGKMRKVSIQ